jgi:uncharacterized membrane protein AbrB (regulator of aidB expression)
MDYKGQQLSELLFYYITIVFGSIGWIVGYWYQDFSYVFYPWLVGVVLSTLVSEGKKRIVLFYYVSVIFTCIYHRF